MMIIILLPLLSIFTYCISGNFLHLVLIWNLILAILPLLVQRHFLKASKAMKVVIFLIWLLFIPNTFYLVTDLIHIQFIEFKTIVSPYEAYYNINITPWVELINLTAYACFGIFVGGHSVVNFSKILKKKHFIYMFEAVISILIAFGIYIGRFLRFNSWDILAFPTLANKIILSIDIFTLQFVLFLSICIYMVIQIMKHNKSRAFIKQ